MEDDLRVVIQGTTYSLVERPASNTQLVLSKRAKLLGQIDLKTLVQDLRLVGMCIRIAYNGVTAAGPKFTELQIDIQDLGYDVTNLCDKSGITVTKFKRACETILGNLQTAYKFLLDNFEDMALDTLSSVSELAGKMAIAARDLHTYFHNEAVKVREVAKKTKREQGQQGILVEGKKQEGEELEKEQKKQEEELRKARRDVEVAEEMVRRYEMKVDEAIESLGDDSDLLTQIANGLTSKYLGIRLFDESHARVKELKLQESKEKKLQALENRKKQVKIRKEAYDKLNNFAVKAGRCSGENEMAKAAVKALHEAMSGLQMLAALMMQAALFWQQMQEHCKALGEDEMKRMVEKAIQKYDNGKRRKLWTSRGFKSNAVCFSADWVALNDVCGEYMLAIQETQRDLYKYIAENPTYEQAETNIKVLAAKFETELGEAQKAITEQELVTDEEIRSLRDKSGF